MATPDLTPAQKQGCGILVMAACALFGLPLSLLLWKWALTGWGW